MNTKIFYYINTKLIGCNMDEGFLSMSECRTLYKRFRKIEPRVNTARVEFENMSTKFILNT